MKTLILAVIVPLVILLGHQYGIKPAFDRIYYGPDKSDCIRIEGCGDGDMVYWSRADIDTAFICVDNAWIVYVPVDGGDYDF